MNYAHKANYFFSGLFGRWAARRTCPACKSAAGKTVDSKYFHILIECHSCGLLYRFPVETAREMLEHYHDGYSEPGLTTELPDKSELQRLLDSGFRKSGKDFTYQGDILEALGLGSGTKLLDYGANWGYASWQFARRGFIVASYEVSAPKAAFGRKLGLTIHTNLVNVGMNFDAVYSSHVLEHTPDPMGALALQLELIKPGGLVIGHTPNGSIRYRQSAGRSFSKTWGYVHPVLLTDRFVAHVAGSRPFFVTSDDRPANVRGWNQSSQIAERCDGSGLFFAIRREA